MVSADVPPKAVKYYNDAVATLQEELSHRRGVRNTDQVVDDLRKAVHHRLSVRDRFFQHSGNEV